MTSCAWLWLYFGAFLMLMELLAPGFVVFFFGLSASTVGLCRFAMGESFTLTDSLTFELPPHGSRLLAVSPADPDQLIDANIRILRTEKQDRELKLYFDYANAAEFTFASQPAAVTLDGKPVPVNGTTVKADIAEKSVMTVKFA